MAVFRCESCMALLKVRPGQNVCTCEYCGAVQTIRIAEETPEQQPETAEPVEEMYRKAMAALVDERWGYADNCANNIQRKYPGYIKAQLIHLMAVFQVSEEEDLGKLTKNISADIGYQMIMGSNDEELKARVRGYFASSIVLYVEDVVKNSSSKREHKRVLALLSESNDIEGKDELIRQVEEKLARMEEEKKKKEYMEKILREWNQSVKKAGNSSDRIECLKRIKDYSLKNFAESPYTVVIIFLMYSKKIFSYASGTTFRVKMGDDQARCVYLEKDSLHLLVCRKSVTEGEMTYFSWDDPDCKEKNREVKSFVVDNREGLLLLCIKQKNFGYEIIQERF